MIQNIKNELRNIISGKSSSSYDAITQTVASYLRTGESSGPMAEKKHQNKPQEAARLIKFAEENDLFISEIDPDNFISSGAEQKVYIQDERYVLKLNDAVYYASWEDYFHNLLLHNYFFSDTEYELIGFHLLDKVLYAVVRQPFIKADNVTDLSSVKLFLENNGFVNKKRHDYYHPELGLIIEDLHDENVLTNDELLYFIDTVFFIEPEIFWKD